MNKKIYHLRRTYNSWYFFVSSTPTVSFWIKELNANIVLNFPIVNDSIRFLGEKLIC
jgi:hypothetical protein